MIDYLISQCVNLLQPASTNLSMRQGEWRFPNRSELDKDFAALQLNLLRRLRLLLLGMINCRRLSKTMKQNGFQTKLLYLPLSLSLSFYQLCRLLKYFIN